MVWSRVMHWIITAKIESSIILSILENMSLHHKQPPMTFEPMMSDSTFGPYIEFHFAIIKEFNKPNRKRVISWFVVNYVGDLQYSYLGRRIVSVHKNYGLSHEATQKYLSR